MSAKRDPQYTIKCITVHVYTVNRGPLTESELEEHADRWLRDQHDEDPDNLAQREYLAERHGFIGPITRAVDVDAQTFTVCQEVEE